MICMFNSWVDSTTRFGFLKIKGLHLGLSEGSCHGKRMNDSDRRRIHLLSSHLLGTALEYNTLQETSDGPASHGST